MFLLTFGNPPDSDRARHPHHSRMHAATGVSSCARWRAVLPPPRRRRDRARRVVSAAADDSDAPSPSRDAAVATTSATTATRARSRSRSAREISSSIASYLAALRVVNPTRYAAIATSMARYGGGALRKSRTKGAFPDSWSLPFAVGVELLAGFLEAVTITEDEMIGVRAGDERALRAIGAYVKVLRGAMAVGVPPLP